MLAALLFSLLCEFELELERVVLLERMEAGGAGETGACVDVVAVNPLMDPSPTLELFVLALVLAARCTLGTGTLVTLLVPPPSPPPENE